MERFKCIKEYPGSPDKGTVVYHPHRSRAYSDEHFKTKNDKNCTNNIFYSKEYIKGYPEFWKEIKTKK